MSRFQGVSLLIRFQWKGAQQCREEHPGPTSRRHLADLVSGIWYLVVADPGHLVRSPAASIVSTSLAPILASFILGHSGYHRYSIKGTVTCALVSALAYYREAVYILSNLHLHISV